MKKSQIILAILIIPFISCAVSMIVLINVTENCSKLIMNSTKEMDLHDTDVGFLAGLYEVFPISQLHHKIIFCYGITHGALCVAATALTGINIVLYRLTRGLTTVKIKYVHAILHLISIILFGYSFWHVSLERSTCYWNYHNFTSWVTFAAYILQFVIAVVIFLALRNIRKRLMFAPFHDIIGIWIYTCLLACCISGKTTAAAFYSRTNNTIFLSFAYIEFIIIFTVVLSPFFEWELIGIL